MDFDWIKNLFKRKNIHINVDNNSVVTIDTSKIKIPNIKSLPLEYQHKVMEYFNEIKYENYETVINYSKKLLTKSNEEVAILSKVIDKYNELYSSNKAVNDINYKYVYANLVNNEYNIIIENLKKIRLEMELRLIALDLYIKKEEMRKYDFLGIFGKAERLRYLTDKSGLLNERQCLKNAIKINEQQQSAVRYDVMANEGLLKSIKKFGKYESLLSDNYDFSYEAVQSIIKEHGDEIIDKLKLIGNIDEFENELKEKYLNLEIILNNYKNNNKIHNFIKEQYLYYVSNILKIISFSSHELEIYAYRHKDDYKKVIREMNELCNKYEQELKEKHFSEWNCEDIRENTIKYANLIKLLTKICGRYLNSDNYFGLVKEMVNLEFYWLVLDKNYNYHEYWDLNIYYDKNIAISYAKSASINHLNKCIELFNNVLEKYNIDTSIFNDMFMLDGNKKDHTNKIVRVLIENHEIKYLYDLLRNNFDVYDLSFIDEIPFDNHFKNLIITPLLTINGNFLKVIKDSKSKLALLDSITIKKLGYFKRCDDISLTYDKNISLKEISKILKFIGIDKFDEGSLIRHLGLNLMYSDTTPIDKTLKIIYTKIFINRIRKEEKEEIILTIPNTIKLSKEYNTPFNKSIIYLENYDDLII